MNKLSKLGKILFFTSMIILILTMGFCMAYPIFLSFGVSIFLIIPIALVYVLIYLLFKNFWDLF